MLGYLGRSHLCLILIVCITVAVLTTIRRLNQAELPSKVSIAPKVSLAPLEKLNWSHAMTHAATSGTSVSFERGNGPTFTTMFGRTQQFWTTNQISARGPIYGFQCRCNMKNQYIGLGTYPSQFRVHQKFKGAGWFMAIRCDPRSPPEVEIAAGSVVRISNNAVTDALIQFVIDVESKVQILVNNITIASSEALLADTVLFFCVQTMSQWYEGVATVTDLAFIYSKTLHVAPPIEAKSSEQTCVKCPSCLQSNFDACLSPERHRLRNHPDCYEGSPLCSRHIWDCPGTGVYFTHPLVTITELAAMYGKHYHGQSTLSADHSRPVWQFNYIKSHVLKNGGSLFPKTNATILEVGCAGGFLLAKLGARGRHRLLCFEPDKALRVKAQKYIESTAKADSYVQVMHGFWDPQHIPKGSLDLFISSHVLEHVPDLCVFLKEVYDALKPGGFVFTEIPNTTPEYIKRYPNKHIKKLEFHVTLPTQRGFLIMMENTGFELVDMSLYGFGDEFTMGGGLHVRSVFQKPHARSSKDWGGMAF